MAVTSAHCEVVILAAGIGKRMRDAYPGLPKVLVPVAGRPMIDHLLDAVEKSGVASGITVVVGPGVEESIRTALRGRQVNYAMQKEQKGTGHAVLSAREHLPTDGNILVLYGDHPLFSAATLRRIAETHVEKGATVTMLTVPVPDFEDWRSPYKEFGRIVRHESGTFERVVEFKDATWDEKNIREVNPAVYCFDATWLWAHLPRLGNNNAQGEFYLTDIPQMAVAERKRMETVQVEDAREALGANSPEELAVLEEIAKTLLPVTSTL